MRAIGYLLLAALISFTHAGCWKRTVANSEYTIDGKSYGVVKGNFNHRWWNYFERGLSFSDGEFYQEAISDFEKAIEQRFRDQRTARTYGFHVIDYFPHRELGITHYHIGNIETAKTELELSLEQYPSAKAYFYLDRVRKAIIDQTSQDWLPPKIILDSEISEIWTRDDPVVISGVAKDQNYISAFTIYNQPIFIESSKNVIQFEKHIDLPRGKHVVEIKATSLLGKVTEKKLTVHVDRDGPLLTIENIEKITSDSQTKVSLQGFVHDESGIHAIIINEVKEIFNETTEHFFSNTFTTDKNSVRIVIADKLGNRTTANINIPDQSTARNPVYLAALNSPTIDDTIIALLLKKDKTPPHIQLKHWSPQQTVYLETIYLEGNVVDGNTIQSLTINNAPVLHRNGQQVYFSYFFSLHEGKNIIDIEATDKEGNVSKKTITVIRKIPEALLSSERLSLSVLTFEQKGLVSPDSISFQSNLLNSLNKQDRFRLVEREHLESILQEQKLSAQALTDRATAVRIGKLIAAQSIVTGNLIRSQKGIEIIGRIIDTETSEILATEDVYTEHGQIRIFQNLSDAMAIKFHRDFPLVNGNILQCKGGHIFTSIGKDQLAQNKRLIIYREEPILDAGSEKIFGMDFVVIGRAKLTQLFPTMSKAEIFGCAPDHVKNDYKVITE